MAIAILTSYLLLNLAIELAEALPAFKESGINLEDVRHEDTDLNGLSPSRQATSPLAVQVFIMSLHLYSCRHEDSLSSLYRCSWRRLYKDQSWSNIFTLQAMVAILHGTCCIV